ncbi:MAG: carboxypeptidase regulatory-like domain-containing protein [Terracidiphilus sp.]
MHSIGTRCLRTLTLFAFVLAVSSLAFAQGVSGSLTGQVSDPTGAAVAGATVTLVNLGTNFQQTAKTDGSGIYLIRPVDPGAYVLQIDASGFAKYVQKGIVIHVSQDVTQNVTLKVGAVGQTVSVTADAELVNTTSAELGMTVNEASVTGLPLNGRDPSSLVLLTPGTANVIEHGGEGIQTGFSFPTETGASSNGGRQGSTFYQLDGVSNMDNYNLLTAPFPNADATQEFTVLTNNFSAQYGFAPGAVVSIATRGGTNQYHGGVFWFVRNYDLNAADWFSHEVDPLKRNQFGGFAGGPVIKDKLFFFANYQGTRQIAASTSNNTYVPTPAMLQGDFSGLATTAGVTNLTGPFQTVNGKANQLDTSLAQFDSAAVSIAQDGLANLIGASGQSANGHELYETAPIKNVFDEGTARLDYDLNAKQRLTLRSYTNHLYEPSGDVPGNILSVININNWTYGFQEQMYYFNDVLTHTWTINPTTVNTVSAFWNEQSAHNAAAVLGKDGQPMCFSKYINVNELPGQCYMEGFTVTGGAGGFNGGWTEPSQEVRNTYGLQDMLGKSLGKHSLSAGVDAMHQFAEEFTQYPTTPIVTFNGSYTGNGIADFLLGYLDEYEQGAGEIADVAGWQVAPFVQDDWRLRNNLTVNLGLRWDPNTAPTSAGGRGAAFVAGQQSSMFPNSPVGLIFPGDSGMSSTLMPDSYGYWEPRLGMAWQPKQLPHTVIHAGFGLFTGPLPYSDYNHAADIAPSSPLYNVYGSSSSCETGGEAAKCASGADQTISGNLVFDNPWSTFAGTGGKSPFPPFTSVSYKPASSYTFTTPITVDQSFARSFKLPVTESWNLSIEQQINASMAVRMAYVGSESYHMTDAIDENAATADVRPYSSFAQILTDFSGATSSYNALQVGVDRRMARGLQAQSSFTWSKAIDIASSGDVSFGKPYLGDPFDLNWSRGNSNLSVPFNWVTNFIYQTPDLHGQSLLMREVLGGWQLSSIITWQSGNPFSVMSAGYSWNSDDSGSEQYLDRADHVSGQPLNAGKGSHWDWTKTGYFNQAAFNNNAMGTFGDSGRNLMFGPRQFNTDAGITKNWSLAEHTNLQFRWEAFNATNHPNFANPAAPWGSFTGWASVVGPQWNANNTIVQTGNYPPRVMQGALKLTF